MLISLTGFALILEVVDSLLALKVVGPSEPVLPVQLALLREVVVVGRHAAALAEALVLALSLGLAAQRPDLVAAELVVDEPLVGPLQTAGRTC